MNAWMIPVVLVVVGFLLSTLPSAVAIYRYWFGGGRLLEDRLPPPETPSHDRKSHERMFR